MPPRPLLLATVVVLAACGDPKVAPPPPVVAKPDPQPAIAAAAPVVAEARASLGEALAARLDFVAQAEGDRLVAVVPKDWKAEDGVRTPPAEAELGAMSSLAVGTSCAGTCAAKDWPSVAVKQELGPLSGVDYTTVKSEDLPDGKLVVSRSVDRTYVVLVRWKIGAPRYAFCKATLDPELGDAVPAFEKACRGLTVLSWE